MPRCPWRLRMPPQPPELAARPPAAAPGLCACACAVHRLTWTRPPLSPTSRLCPPGGQSRTTWAGPPSRLRPLQAAARGPPCSPGARPPHASVRTVVCHGFSVFSRHAELAPSQRPSCGQLILSDAPNPDGNTEATLCAGPEASPGGGGATGLTCARRLRFAPWSREGHALPNWSQGRPGVPAVGVGGWASDVWRGLLESCATWSPSAQDRLLGAAAAPSPGAALASSAFSCPCITGGAEVTWVLRGGRHAAPR